MKITKLVCLTLFAAASAMGPVLADSDSQESNVQENPWVDFQVAKTVASRPTASQASQNSWAYKTPGPKRSRRTNTNLSWKLPPTVTPNCETDLNVVEEQLPLPVPIDPSSIFDSAYELTREFSDKVEAKYDEKADPLF